VVVVTVVLVRPWLRRIGLAYFARVSVVLSIVAITMVSALLAGPWMHSDLLWGSAFFPVIVLGMLAEGIASTLDRDNLLAASWRATTTVALAFLIALLGRVPALRAALLQCPEITITQVVAIVFIGKYLDFRLLQDWDSHVAGLALPKLISGSNAFRIAVIRNHLRSGVLGRLGSQAPDRELNRSVQRHVDALRDGGHTVRVLEGDASLLRELRQFIPSDPRTGEPGGIAFNLAGGLQGDDRATHVPAMLEMAGVAYIGSPPRVQALLADRLALSTLLRQSNIPTLPFRLVTRPEEIGNDLEFPVLVHARHEPHAKPLRVSDARRLERAVRRFLQKHRQEVILQSLLPGRRLHVGLLGNASLEALPLVELDREHEQRLCPAPVDEATHRRIVVRAKTAFRLVGCRDYARVSILLGDNQTAYVTGIETLGILRRNGSFMLAATRARYTESGLLCHIAELARARYVPHAPLRMPQRVES
jgi:D-alanine-D-alanine ligase